MVKVNTEELAWGHTVSPRQHRVRTFLRFPDLQPVIPLAETWAAYPGEQGRFPIMPHAWTGLKLPVHRVLIVLAPTTPTPEGAFGKNPLAPGCGPSLHPPCPHPHEGGTHMRPPGRSSLVSIPSFSISICRKVLTFCRVSSSEYLQGCREGEGCSPSFRSLPALPLLLPQP